MLCESVEATQDNRVRESLWKGSSGRAAPGTPARIASEPEQSPMGVQ